MWEPITPIVCHEHLPSCARVQGSGVSLRKPGITFFTMPSFVPTMDHLCPPTPLLPHNASVPLLSIVLGQLAWRLCGSTLIASHSHMHTDVDIYSCTYTYTCTLMCATALCHHTTHTHITQIQHTHTRTHAHTHWHYDKRLLGACRACLGRAWVSCIVDQDTD